MCLPFTKACTYVNDWFTHWLCCRKRMPWFVQKLRYLQEFGFGSHIRWNTVHTFTCIAMNAQTPFYFTLLFTSHLIMVSFIELRCIITFKSYASSNFSHFNKVILLQIQLISELCFIKLSAFPSGDFT